MISGTVGGFSACCTMDIKCATLWSWGMRCWGVYMMAIVSGCVSSKKHDPLINKSKADFCQLTQPPCGTLPAVVPVPPVIQKKCVYPPSFYKKVSLSLAGKVPMTDVLTDLCEQVGVNVILDALPVHQKHIYFSATNQPFIHVLDHLCMVCGLKYSFRKGALSVSADSPFVKNHNVQFLLGFRKTQTQTSVKTDVFSGGMVQKCDTSALADNGSTVSVNSYHTADFWEELDKNVRLIIAPSPTGVSNYSINRYAGLLTVYGTQKEQCRIEKYLKKLYEATMSQILIEAKIIEIDLKEEYKNGIDWNAFFGPRYMREAMQKQLMSSTDSPIGAVSSMMSSQSDSGLQTIHLNTPYITAVASLMEHFGTVRTLANPRQTVMNNQSAILKVAHNEVFFELQIQDDYRTDGFAGLRQRAQSRIQTVPIGLILYVHPSLNSATGDIILSIRPSISRVKETRSDPAAMLYTLRSQNAGGNSVTSNPKVLSEIPVVQVREMDSVIVAKEGQVILTGGLMEERVSRDDTGVPGVSKTRLGGLFGMRKGKREMTELVILLKLTVVKNHNSIAHADKRLYKEFTADPRPTALSSSESVRGR